MKLNDILTALPNLSQHDLITLRAAIDHFVVDVTPVQDDTTPLYEAMTKLLGVNLTYRDFHNVPIYRTWKRKAPNVIAFIERTFGDKVTRVAKMAMMSLLLEALIEDLQARNIGVSLNTVAVNIDRLPHLFDLSFPSYRESGLAHVVLEAMERK